MGWGAQGVRQVCGRVCVCVCVCVCVVYRCGEKPGILSIALERRISLLGMVGDRRIGFRQSSLAATSSGQRQSGDEPRVEGTIRTAGLKKHTEEFRLVQSLTHV